MRQELGKEASDEEVTLAILSTFYKKDTRSWIECILEFNYLIKEQYAGSLKMNLDFENMPAEYFIIADTYVSLADITSLYNHLTGDSKKDISVSLATRVKNDFLNSVSHFKDKYEWIYNPPILPGINKHSIGKVLRSEFQQHYGAYAEMTYLLSCGNALKFDKVNKMKLSEYLALGEYVLRKRAVESAE